MSQFHNEQFCIYTDGSKSDDGVGCSAVSLRGSKQMKLMAESSIFTAELCGLLCGLQLANQLHRDSFVIISDSRSALQVVEHYDSTHPLIHKVIHWLHRLHRCGKTVYFCWCPSHVGVLGNKSAAAAALDASNSEVPFRDWYPIIRSRVKHKWKDEWLAIGTNKLRSLKSSVDVWPSSCDRYRKVSCILTRLRIGHTRLTHQHLMENRPPPYCTDCLVLLTVRHFLAECPSYEDARYCIFPQTIGRDVDQTLQMMLSENLG